VAEAELDLAGPAAPPRRNGELAFAAPWESRVFGATLALVERGALDWEAFRARLIAAITAHDAEHPGEPTPYWSCWLSALESLLSDTRLCRADDVLARERELAARPPGHDHGEAPSSASSRALASRPPR
jgi:nitrile hydratase accessory protein